MKRRVVVTGMGVVSPLGCSLETFAENLRKMYIGIDKITSFDATNLPVQIAAEVKDFKPEEYMDRKLAKRLDRFSQFALAATRQAVEMSGIDFTGIEERVAILVSSGMGGFLTLAEQNDVLREKGPERVSPFLIPMILINMASGVIAMEYGLKGPNFAPVSACATSVHSIALGALLIRHGYADVAIVGGSEATIAPLPIAGFASMRALSTRNDEPKKASRPFDKSRDGFVMGEGAGILILENEEFAKARGANIIAEIKGFAMNDDAHHFSAPDPEARGSSKVMKMAIDDSGLSIDDIDFVSCHATSTPAGDEVELKAIENVFENRVKEIYVNSTKTLTGHLLGATGAVETIASIIQMNSEFIHGMPNLEELDGPDYFNIPRNTVEGVQIRNFVKNSFGFGGHNASLVVGRYE
ncbi:3-oxoacyl-[acyl-carrier-protein] synthase II [Fervidobacterium changbaicum]|uniref:3-oxoacyl-[acyl-carrier-protein] synthase 2 n=1 Tax=Fervidobacterium changbaicum TaxID=310769 RepID=A0ABX5QQF9_9BACT|nr:beta-ketoacyl-ACP synthase II [Fervidobacterium changbaicum]QAV32562.1 beta-ketoacyl-[acyl-carrier-protein] synthase II [Fervidobacterium changbaicum]SDH66865.1 3-oxoacyl-[acyl-carrier-protein] synthase II [Fervidobacterium changbaicum]